MKDEILYIDINKEKISNNIDVIFPQWEDGNERLCVFSPHDDDALIGAGYAMEAVKRSGGEVYVFIFCSGNAGYSKIEQKNNIVEIRKKETINAYKEIGIEEKNIFRFDYSDFSAFGNIGWKLINGCEGSFKKIITKFRELKITRVMVPNHYREHIDHLAVSMIGSFDSPQAGDPIVLDWGKPFSVKNILEYSVWADLSPEDAIIEGRNTKLRANRVIAVNSVIEEKVRQGISCYKSQGEIIKGLVESRKERLCENNMYLEVYLSFDPRPKLDFEPYKEVVNSYTSL